MFISCMPVLSEFIIIMLSVCVCFIMIMSRMFALILIIFIHSTIYLSKHVTFSVCVRFYAVYL